MSETLGKRLRDAEQKRSAADQKAKRALTVRERLGAAAKRAKADADAAIKQLEAAQHALAVEKGRAAPRPYVPIHPDHSTFTPVCFGCGAATTGWLGGQTRCPRGCCNSCCWGWHGQPDADGYVIQQFDCPDYTCKCKQCSELPNAPVPNHHPHCQCGTCAEGGIAPEHRHILPRLSRAPPSYEPTSPADQPVEPPAAAAAAAPVRPVQHDKCGECRLKGPDSLCSSCGREAWEAWYKVHPEERHEPTWTYAPAPAAAAAAAASEEMKCDEEMCDNCGRVWPSKSENLCIQMGCNDKRIPDAPNAVNIGGMTLRSGCTCDKPVETASASGWAVCGKCGGAL